ncbi:recombinase family protein [Bradyrhizobium sp. USDA 10063]
MQERRRLFRVCELPPLLRCSGREPLHVLDDGFDRPAGFDGSQQLSKFTLDARKLVLHRREVCASLHPQPVHLAGVVRRIFADYLAGKSSRTIAFELNQEGVPGPQGAEWGSSTIHSNPRRGVGILNNELYAGHLVWNRLPA